MAFRLRWLVFISLQRKGAGTGAFSMEPAKGYLLANAVMGEILLALRFPSDLQTEEEAINSEIPRAAAILETQISWILGIT
ncbi:hypothetical protein B0H65DRAFT_338760 [Neurospora tetraspora]|uniref:Uncharacterized protein n=1 Tax=Neurospora tetraspora TaxID=94610 RepID=A0AAE0J112_9PEZI|nr:hypothetical protein B0H65DRAFT_338760 [Neurospora tetraspora]